MYIGNKAKELEAILVGQDFVCNGQSGGELEYYKDIAHGYAMMENSIAVLSDMSAGISYIYYGGFAGRLGLGHERPSETITSIWEEDILRLIHPDDLPAKYLHELDFFRFIMNRPAAHRRDFFMADGLRMRTVSGRYVSVLHRLFYVPDRSRESMRLALCLYGPLPPGFGVRCTIFDTVSGRVTGLASHGSTGLLSDRELQVLRLISNGMSSKDIAEELSISINTVNRHRQNILDKLHVQNSMAACRMAVRLRLI